MALNRLDKIICDAGLATRSEARRFIAAGRVRVEGQAITDPAFKADETLTAIIVDGQPIKTGFRYLMMYKPEGVLSATEDRNQKTVLALLPKEYGKLGLFPVGRLDKDTTGLLILTNNGDFCHEVTSPKHHIKKLYEFTAVGPLEYDDIKAFERGIILQDGTECLPALLEIDENDPTHGYVSVYEGKYHQVKRMLASRGKPVNTLKRLAVGGLELDAALRPGEFKELSENDIKSVVNKNVTE